jgi:hypothetical protein
MTGVPASDVKAELRRARQQAKRLRWNDRAIRIEDANRANTLVISRK